MSRCLKCGKSSLGGRLICPPVLRLISKRLPAQFPYQSNWRGDACHFAYWELFPTLDHIIPVARGGADDGSNWVTSSMIGNSAKSNWTLTELHWSLHPPGDMRKWDGLLGWFMEQMKPDPSICVDSYMRDWHNAARSLYG